MANTESAQRSRDPGGLDSRVLVMVPCYNEGAMIADLLREIRNLGQGYDTIVIDDGSSDDTYSVASTLSPTVRLIANLGIGGAVQTAIKYAHRHRYEFCVQIDGDGQHPPEEVVSLLNTYFDVPANVIIGSRYIEGVGFRSTLARRLGSRLIGAWLKLLFGQRVTDSTSGLRLMDTRAIDFFARSYPCDFPEPISIAWALRHHLTVREVPVRMRERHHGRSSITGPTTVAYIIRVMSYIALAKLERIRGESTPGGRL